MTQVEYYVCPSCGKTTPIKSFNPIIYPNTLGSIQIREGGGRGSGFKLLEQHLESGGFKVSRGCGESERKN